MRLYYNRREKVTTDEQWHLRFLSVARLISTWSKDPSTKVGAVITDNLNRFVSLGYNGLAQGVPDKAEVWGDRELKYEHVIHAEENAMIFAQRSLRNCTLYTYPFPPCSRCASKFIQAGILRVVSVKPTENIYSRWQKSLDIAHWLYQQAGVQFLLYNHEDVLHDATSLVRR